MEIVGQLIDKYGYSTYGGNSHMFADSQEGWVLIDFAGNKGLWIAERLGPNDIRMSYPGYILEIRLISRSILKSIEALRTSFLLRSSKAGTTRIQESHST